MALSLTGGIKSSRVSPAFLHGNSTSHTWPFSAIAELIDNAYDNAYDPDVRAGELQIDQREVGGFECLSFVDNGNGMNEDKLYKMLSFGYCEKVQIGSVKPIGYYGNGFKSGSMRLGEDALVFTRCLTSTSVGFLSQTYLRATEADAVLVPIVTWHLPCMTRPNTRESNINLQTILTYSAINREEDLLTELKLLEDMKTGTSIIIYNLKKDRSGTYELDFKSEEFDIRNPETQVADLSDINRPIHTSTPEYRRSLREYCSILYLKPRMKIVLRGQKVVTKLISKSLSQTEIDVYKPTWHPRPIRLTFGFTDNKEPESYGLMMYHNNRLVRAYEKIGCQKQANDHGVGVVGVVEANFLEPIHNKQDFNRTDRYSAFMQSTAIKLNDYYFEKTQSEDPEANPALNMSQLPDWVWAQCDNCLSWRRLPTGYQENLPEKWFCRMNPDAAFNRCDILEEPEDDDEALQKTYKKTWKRKEYIEKKKRQAQLAEQVSSSQDKVDKQTAERDLELAKVNLQVEQLKCVEQQRVIKRLKKQKRKNKKKRRASLQKAKSYELEHAEGKKLAEKAQEMAGTSSASVTSSSTTLRTPIKRNASSDEGGSGGKVLKMHIVPHILPVSLTYVSDEESDYLFESPNQTEASDPGSDQDVEKDTTMAAKSPNQNTTHGSHTETAGCSETGKTGDSSKPSKDKTNGSIEKRKATKPTEIDKSDGAMGDCEKATKTSSVQDKDKSYSYQTQTDSYTEMEDVKPVKEELDKQIYETRKICLAHKGSQTVPTVIKFASPEEVDLEKLSPLEQKHMLLQKVRELDESKKSLHSLQENMHSLQEDKHSLQENIWQLLNIINPDYDYGNPGDIEDIIVSFIQANEDNS